MYLPDYAAATPDKPAMISADTGDILTFGELNEASNRMAQLLYARGLRRGDHLAILMENNLHFMEPVWAGFRSGLLRRRRSTATCRRTRPPISSTTAAPRPSSPPTRSARPPRP